MKQKNFAIIGAGKVGHAIAYGLTHCGYRLAGVVSKNITSARALAEPFGAAYTTEGARLIRQIPVVFITTPDGEISSVIGNLAAQGGCFPGQYFFHTCGSMGAKVLQPAKEQGAYVGSLHPLQSFAQKGAVDFKNLYFALSGDKEAVDLAEKLVCAWQGYSFVVPEEGRPLYHGAACIVSNYMVVLFHWGVALYERLGLAKEAAVSALLPLAQGTLENIGRIGPDQALTGPICRGDSQTVARHLSVLAGAEKVLYRQLAEYTMGIAHNRGSLGQAQLEELQAIIDGGKQHEKR